MIWYDSKRKLEVFCDKDRKFDGLIPVELLAIFNQLRIEVAFLTSIEDETRSEILYICDQALALLTLIFSTPEGNGATSVFFPMVKDEDFRITILVEGPVFYYVTIGNKKDTFILGTKRMDQKMRPDEVPDVLQGAISSLITLFPNLPIFMRKPENFKPGTYWASQFYEAVASSNFMHPTEKEIADVFLMSMVVAHLQMLIFKESVANVRDVEIERGNNMMFVRLFNKHLKFQHDKSTARDFSVSR